MATMREMACIHLIVDTLRIPFEGDFKNSSDVKQFIYQNYNRAMMVRKQLRDLQDWADTLLLQEAIFKDADMAADKKKTKQCPDFPFFGANYPDATCIDGYLYDLDNCDAEGNLYEPPESIPCPFCNKQEFFEKFGCEDDDSNGKEVYQSIITWVKEKYPDFVIEEVSKDQPEEINIRSLRRRRRRS